MNLKNIEINKGSYLICARGDNKKNDVIYVLREDYKIILKTYIFMNLSH